MLILDILVAVLLVITIAFAFVLNKRLGRLRGDRKAFEKLAKTFGDATSRAEEGINALHQTTDVLQERLDKAQALKDDLTFMTERGDRTADKLEKLVRMTRDTSVIDPEVSHSQGTHARTQSSPVPGGEPQSVVEPENGSGDKSEAERELLKAIRSSV